MINIGVISPQVLTRKGLCALLRPVRDFRVVLEADAVTEKLGQATQPQAEILLIDSFQVGENFEVVSGIRQILPETKLLLLVDRVEQDFELRAVRAGCQGCLSKVCEPKLMERALRALSRGEMWISHQTASHIARRFLQQQKPKGSDREVLSKREREILAGVARGERNKEIATRLFVSENTVRTHLFNIYRKLQVNTRMAAALYFFQHANEHPGSLQAFNLAGSGKELPPKKVA